MALSFNSTQKAREVLAELIGTSRTISYDDDKPLRTGYIIEGFRNPDGGVEFINVNIQNPTKEQINFFEENKNIIHNTSIHAEKENGIVRLGWF